MKCPYCNEEMVKGYIQCRDGVDWTEKKQVIAALSALGKGRTAKGSSSPEWKRRSSQDVPWRVCAVKLTPLERGVAPFNSKKPGRTGNPAIISVGRDVSVFSESIV